MDLTDQKTQITLLVIAAVLGGMYAWFTYIYSPRDERIGVLEGERDQLVLDIRLLQRQVARFPEVEADLAEALVHWNEVLVAFPTEPKEEEVIANLNISEQSAGLFISGMQKGTRRARPLYFEQDYTVNLVGEYATLSRFITTLRDLPRRISVERLKLTHPSAGQSGGGGAGFAPLEQEVIITLTVTTYIVRVTAAAGGG